MENKLKISVGQITRIREAFSLYTGGVKFVSEEAEKEAVLAYFEAYARKLAEDPDTFLGIPTLKEEAVRYGALIPVYVLAYYKANSALKKIEAAYSEAEEALIGIGYTSEAAARRLSDISGAKWNAERVRESAYEKLKKEGGDIWGNIDVLEREI